jgi:hypothetical protein
MLIAAPLTVLTALTVNAVIGEPPSVAGAAQMADTDRTPGLAPAIRGAAGAVTGVTALESAEKAPAPIMLLAATWSR